MAQRYELNLDKIVETIRNSSNFFKGVYVDSVPENAPFRSHVNYAIKNLNENPEFLHPPFLYVNEAVEEHTTQIIYLLKENFVDRSKGFIGWQPFTKDLLTKLFKDDAYVYKENFSDGNQFVDDFPKALDHFLNEFCTNIDNENV